MMTIAMSDEWKMLNDAIHYDPETGVFRWRRDAGRCKAGDVAGSYNDQGYWRLKVKNRQYRANRLAYFLMKGEWPKHEVDHINGIRDDNRWCNLRHVTRTQNETNKPHVGVRCQHGRYDARIRINGRRLYLGRFKDKAEASAAYRKAAERYHGDYQRQT